MKNEKKGNNKNLNLKNKDKTSIVRNKQEEKMKKDIATVLIIGNTTETGTVPAELFHGQIPEIVEKDHDVIGWGKEFDGKRTVYHFEHQGFDFIIPNGFEKIEDYIKALQETYQ